jgi:transketolase
MILVRTHLGYGSPEQDSFKAHGSPLGEENVRKTKEKLSWPADKQFYVPEEALKHFREAVDNGKKAEADWNARIGAYKKAFADQAQELADRQSADPKKGWDADIEAFPADKKGVSTRVAGGKIMNAVAKHLPQLMGGSADLDPSTFTNLKGFGDFNPTPTGKFDDQGGDSAGWSYAGRNIHYGVREHAMGAISNGLAAHGGFIPYGSTFLIFSDYMRPAIRLAALMKLHVVHIYTHDSIALGEDGPTHQPVEQLASLRAIPNVTVIRPGDANETIEAWRVAVESRDHPVLLVLSRQNIPTLDRKQYASADGVRKGAYVLSDAKDTKPELILIGTGSEVGLIVSAAEKLQSEGVAVRCVSMPSWELFEQQPQSYRDEVLPPSVPSRLAVELGSPQGWDRWIGERGDMLGITTFGASAPADVLLEKFGFTVDNVVASAKKLLKK